MHGSATVSTMAILIPSQLGNLLVENSFVEEMVTSKTGSYNFFKMKSFTPKKRKSWLDLHSEGPCRSNRFWVLRTCDITSFAGALIDFQDLARHTRGSLRIQDFEIHTIVPSNTFCETIHPSIHDLITTWFFITITSVVSSWWKQPLKKVDGERGVKRPWLIDLRSSHWTRHHHR